MAPYIPSYKVKYSISVLSILKMRSCCFSDHPLPLPLPSGCNSPITMVQVTNKGKSSNLAELGDSCPNQTPASPPDTVLFPAQSGHQKDSPCSSCVRFFWCANHPTHGRGNTPSQILYGVPPWSTSDICRGCWE